MNYSTACHASHRSFSVSSVTERFSASISVESFWAFEVAICLISYANKQMNYIEFETLCILLSKWIYEFGKQQTLQSKKNYLYSQSHIQLMDDWVFSFSFHLAKLFTAFSFAWMFMRKLFFKANFITNNKELELFLRPLLWTEQKMKLIIMRRKIYEQKAQHFITQKSLIKRLVNG